jgi:hypothetical protein
MPVVVDTPLIHKSLSAYLLTLTPDANIYDNPNQQGTKIPAWFIVHRSPVSIVREIGRAWLTYEIDLYYMLQLNMTNTFDQYAYIADQMNTSFEYLNIFGTESKIHVLERSWGLQLDCLKYSITLKLRVSRSTVLNEKMRVIEDMQVFLKNQPPEPERYAIVIEPSQNGHIDSSSETSIAGQKITLQVFPDDGYELESLSVMAGETPIPTQQTSEGIVFTMPEHAVTVSSIFKSKEKYAYFSFDKSPVTFSSSGDHYTYDESGNTLHLDPQFEYIPKAYHMADGSIVEIPGYHARRVYFLYGRGSSYFNDWLMLYHYTYYMLENVVSLNYEKREAQLYTAWVSPSKLAKTIEPNMTVNLYDDNGNQIAAPNPGPLRVVVVFYYNGGLKNSNFDGESVRIRVTDYGLIQIRTVERLTIEKVEYSIQPVFNWG